MPSRRPTTAAYRQDHRRLRTRLLRQQGCVVWFTGLSGSGKSTLALALERHLLKQGCLAVILDGDDMRRGLCRDLGFSEADRNENVRRVAETAAILADGGLLCMVALISPFRKARKQAKRVIGARRFFEIYVSTELAVCERRDAKGLYRKAKNRELRQFTGVSSPYEPPVAPVMTLDMARTPVQQAVRRLTNVLMKRGVIRLRSGPNP